jgi:Tfp pilus assembly protein PilZ
MRTVVLKFESRTEFEKIYTHEPDGGGVFIETDEEYVLGELVRIYLCFPDIPEGISLRGKVVWRRPPTRVRTALLPGIGVSLSDEYQSQRNFLIDYATGRVEPRRQKDRRIPADFPLEFKAINRWISGRTLNISREGLYVLTNVSVLPGTEIDLRLYFRGTGSAELYRGKVRWEKNDHPNMGIGVEFEFQSARQQKIVTDFVDRREDRLISTIPRMARTSNSNLY